MPKIKSSKRFSGGCTGGSLLRTHPYAASRAAEIVPAASIAASLAADGKNVLMAPVRDLDLSMSGFTDAVKQAVGAVERIQPREVGVKVRETDDDDVLAVTRKQRQIRKRQLFRQKLEQNRSALDTELHRRAAELGKPSLAKHAKSRQRRIAPLASHALDDLMEALPQHDDIFMARLPKAEPAVVVSGVAPFATTAAVIDPARAAMPSAKASAISKGKVLTAKERKKAALAEMQRFQNVLAHPAFRSDPLATVHAHVANSLAAARNL